MKELIYQCLVLAGFPALFRRLKQKDKVTILLYHDISSDHFERHLVELKKHYQMISLQDYFNHRHNNAPCPDYSLIITLDDGHKGNYELLKVLEQHQVCITIFLCSGIIDTNRHYWFEETRDYEDIKHIPERDRLKHLKASTGFERTREYLDRQALSFEEIERMKPWVDFQAHTEFHPCLPFCEDDDAKRELQHSAAVLRQQYGFNINTISYPNGDYGARELEYCRGIYDYGVTVEVGVNDFDTEALQLKRIYIDDDDSVAKLQLKASTFWNFVKHLVKRSA